MGYATMLTDYLCWLMNRSGLEAEGEHGYLRLCEILQSVGFYPVNDMDENRCADCRDLRTEFAKQETADETGQDVILDILDNNVPIGGSMLEFLLVMAEMMSYEMMDSEYEASTRKWMIEILGNCGLDNCTNDVIESDPDLYESKITRITDTVIFRRTGWDGEGGLFPLAYPQYDQRRVEFVIQMNNYIEENYDIT